MKIESQNKKVVHAAHNTLVTRQKKVQELSVLDFPSTSTNALMKAMTALKKSTVAFETVVDGAISLAGMDCHGLPWGFRGQPTPVPTETHAHSHGCGFSWVWVWVTY